MAKVTLPIVYTLKIEDADLKKLQKVKTKVDGDIVNPYSITNDFTKHDLYNEWILRMCKIGIIRYTPGDNCSLTDIGQHIKRTSIIPA